MRVRDNTSQNNIIITCISRFNNLQWLRNERGKNVKEKKRKTKKYETQK